MATPNEDLFQYSARWNSLRDLAAGDPENSIFTDELIALLEERDKEIEFFLENRVTSGDLGGVGVMTPQVVAFPGQWNDIGTTGATRSASPLSVVSAQTFFFPWTAPANMIITDVATNVTSTTTGEMRYGLYNADGVGGLPSTLLTDFGLISTVVIGDNTISGLSTTVTAGTKYWWVHTTTNTRTLRTITVGSAPTAIGFTSPGATSASQLKSTRTHAAGLETTISPSNLGVLTTFPTVKYSYKATV